MLLSLIVGAAAGAMLVALNTHKTDLELQRQAKAHARGLKRGSDAVAKDVDGLLDDWKEHITPAAGDPKGGISVSINDLPG
jgi:hypothetical protein